MRACPKNSDLVEWTWWQQGRDNRNQSVLSSVNVVGFDLGCGMGDEGDCSSEEGHP